MRAKAYFHLFEEKRRSLNWLNNYTFANDWEYGDDDDDSNLYFIFYWCRVNVYIKDVTFMAILGS